MVLDARAMKDINGDEYDDVPGRRVAHERIVDIIIGPGLYKRGNTNGQGFDTETCMERSEVKCRESWSEGRPDVKLASPLLNTEVPESGFFSEPQPMEHVEVGFGRLGEPLQHLQPFQPLQHLQPLQWIQPPPSPERLERRRPPERSDDHRSDRSDGHRSERPDRNRAERSDGRRRVLSSDSFTGQHR